MNLDDVLLRLGLEPDGEDYEPVPLDELGEIERRIGGPLPMLYRDFLERYGRSRFSNLASVALPDSTEVPILTFFGGGDRSPLLKMLDKYQESFPSGMVPMATDPFGNLFLLHAGADDGEVWYADFNKPAAPPNGPGPVGEWYFATVRVANSFVNFLEQVVIEQEQ